MDEFNQDDVLRIRHNLDMANIMADFKNARDRFERFVNNINGKFEAINADADLTTAEKAQFSGVLNRMKNAAYQKFRDLAV